ncbi:MAG: hypothetical protein UH241_07725 [Acutalibacteraceae bacterium]|nr:hypothetical protein [Acutalibacteraceae bacterium]
MDNQVVSGKKTVDPKSSNFFYILVIGVCILFAIISICSTVSHKLKCNQLLEYGKYAQGEVTSVSRVHEDEPYTVRGYFTVGESVYNFSFSSGLHISNGSVYKIIYDKDNPSIYIVEGIDTDFTARYIGLFVSFVMEGGIIVYVVVCIGKKRKNNDIEFNNSNEATERRRKYFEATNDVWHRDFRR